MISPEKAAIWPHPGAGFRHEGTLALVDRLKALFACAVLCALVTGCSQTTATHALSAAALKDAVTPSLVRTARYSEKDKECMARAMFFESKRSSRDGMIAVGTVVMNRKRSGQYPDTICGVVGQKGQFAPGVMTRSMDSKAMPDVMEAAEAVLEGERHPKLKNAMHFHTAGLKFRYNNMHYVTVAGGNSFYEKRGRRWQPLPAEDASVMVASVETDGTSTGTVRNGAAVSGPVSGPVSGKESLVAMALAEPAAASAGASAITVVSPTAYAAASNDGAAIGLGATRQPAEPAPARPTMAAAADVALPSDAPVPSFQAVGNGPADIDPARFQ